MRIFLLLLLTACTVPEAQTIRLSEHTTKLYNEYRSLAESTFFAVSLDGSVASYSYCPELFNCGSPLGREIALNACKAQGGNCVIIANPHRVIWPGEIVFSP